MPITQAADHEVSGLSDERYCNVEDVITVLKRVSVDSEQETLGAWLDHETRDEVIRFYIPDARLWVNGKAGHDFDYHQNVAIEVDGNGLDCLDLSKYGFVPLLAVADLVISNSAQDSDDYVYYSDGRIRPVEQVTSIKYTTGRPYPFFLSGAQNVEMTITWGYVTPPYDIRMAQARKVAADILVELDTADAEDGVVPGGASRLTYGDLNIQVGTAGRFAAAVKALELRALDACRRHRFPKVYTAESRIVGSYARSSGVMWD